MLQIRYTVCAYFFTIKESFESDYLLFPFKDHLITMCMAMIFETNPVTKSRFSFVLKKCILSNLFDSII